MLNINTDVSTLKLNSTIRDTDMAKETASLTRNKILQQSAVSLLQQAKNISSKAILSLY